MNRKAQRERRADEQGFTLVEMLIALVIVAGIAGAIATAVVTSLRAHETSRHRISESNDAQFISSFLVRDAQAAGGTNPATGAIDSSLGVSLDDAAGCSAGSGTLVARFRWIDRAVASAPSRVATYYLAGNLLTRQLCNDGTLMTTTTLGRNVVSAVASCNPSNACASGGSGLPNTVELALTETNTPQVAPGPYTYSLRAFVRPEGQIPPNGGSAQVVPLLALGTGVCDGIPVLSVTGTADITVNGAAIVNSPCTGAMTIQGNPDYLATGGTSVAAGGTPPCVGNRCSQANPLTTFAQPIPDPLAGLPPLPNADCSTGSGNPAQIAGRYQPGIYHDALGLGNGLSQFDSGVYVFCAGFTANSQSQVRMTPNGAGQLGVLFYVAGGALTVNGGADVQMSPLASGNYRDILVWQPASNTTAMSINGNATINNYRGVFYVPRADVTLSGTAGALVGSIIAQRIIFTGTQSTTVGPQSLTITTAILPTGMVGASYSAPLSVTGGLSPYTWSSSALPAGLSLDTSTGVISGTPTATNSGTIVVSVTDSTFSLVSRTLTLTINASLSITTSSLPTGTSGVAYSTTVSATGGATPYTWSATGLPSGLSIAAGTGVISGTPTGSSTSNVTVTVQANGGATASRNYVLVIGTPLSVASPAAIPEATRGTAIPSVQFVPGGGVGPYSWTVSVGALPSGLTLGLNGLLSGTPTANGVFNFTVRVTDAASATATRAYSMTVNDSLNITTASPLASGVIGTAYSATFAATGGTAPRSWAVASGALPTGLSLSSAGALSGTPSSAGAFNFTIAVTDANGATATRAFSLTVYSAITIAGPASPLPSGKGGVAYTSTTVTATGGSGNYSWSSTPLPTGMSIAAATGQISGTPTVSGSFSVTVTVTDTTTNATANRIYSLSIAPGVTNVELFTGNGTAASGDTVVITFSETLNVASFCNSWSGNGSNQSLAGNNNVVVTIADGGAADTLTLAASNCAGGFRLGSVLLGNYVTGTRTFSGSGGNASRIDWNVAARSLTIRLGSGSGGASNTGVALGTPMYTPHSAIASAGGVLIGTTPFTPTGTSRF